MHKFVWSFSEVARQLFSCEEKDNYTEVQTPFLYPDGDVISLYIEPQDDKFKVTDGGGTIGWLYTAAVIETRTPKQDAMIQDICGTLDVEFVGELQISDLSEFDVPDAVFSKAQAAMRVADIKYLSDDNLSDE